MTTGTKTLLKVESSWTLTLSKEDEEKAENVEAVVDFVNAEPYAVRQESGNSCRCRSH